MIQSSEQNLRSSAGPSYMQRGSRSVLRAQKLRLLSCSMHAPPGQTWVCSTKPSLHTVSTPPSHEVSHGSCSHPSSCSGDVAQKGSPKSPSTHVRGVGSAAQSLSTYDEPSGEHATRTSPSQYPAPSP